MKYQAPDICHDITPWHIILTLGEPVLPIPRTSEWQAPSTSFNNFGMSRPRIEPLTRSGQERDINNDEGLKQTFGSSYWY